MKRVRSSLGNKVLTGGILLLVVVFIAVTATFVFNRNREASAAAATMADNRAAVAAELLQQLTENESIAALGRVTDEGALIPTLEGSSTPAGLGALDAAAATTAPGTGIVAVTTQGDAVFSHFSTPSAASAQQWMQLASIRQAMAGRMTDGVEVVGGVPSYDVAVPVQAGGRVAGVVAALAPLPVQAKRFAEITGYPIVFALASSPGNAYLAGTNQTAGFHTTASQNAAMRGGAAVVQSSAVLPAGYSSGGEAAITVVPVAGAATSKPTLYMGVAVPVSQFGGDGQTQMQDLISIILIGLFALLVTVLGLTILVNRMLHRPLQRLENGVARIAGGDYATDVDVTSSDELGHLAGNVNLMRRRISESIEQIRLQANTDSHTGLFNFRYLMNYLRQQNAEAERHRNQLSFLMVDIDHFKAINDEYGHPAGDKALSAIAHLIRENTRKGDVVARYGGEEFAVAMPHTSHEQALVVADKIRHAVASGEIDIGTAKRHITVSVGGASFPDDAQKPDALIGLADAALYVAKNSGRNQVAMAPPLTQLSGRRRRTRRKTDKPSPINGVGAEEGRDGDPLIRVAK
jgi:diguanylate cyclase (GGDEF)-like protein